MMLRGRSSVPLLILLGCAAAQSGCSILLAIPAQVAKDYSDKQTRTEADSLRSLAPGTSVLLRQRHHEPQAARFEGFLEADSVAAAPADTGHAVAVFHRGPRRWELPLEAIDWVQLRSSRAPVYKWFGVGLAIDAAIIYILSRSLSDWGTISDAGEIMRGEEGSDTV